MSTATVTPPAPVRAATMLHRFSVDDYHRLIEAGTLNAGHRVELLEGHLVCKMPHHPPHATALQRTR
jgi:hypothetical protein